MIYSNRLFLLVCTVILISGSFTKSLAFEYRLFPSDTSIERTLFESSNLIEWGEVGEFRLVSRFFSVEAARRRDDSVGRKHRGLSDGQILLLGFSPINGAGAIATGRTVLGTVLIAVECLGALIGGTMIYRSRNDGDTIISEDDFIEAMTGLGIIGVTFVPTYLIDAIGTIFWVRQKQNNE